MIILSTDFPHHRAYRLVHCGSLAFTNFQIVVSHGHISKADYRFFLSTLISIIADHHIPWR